MRSTRVVRAVDPCPCLRVGPQRTPQGGSQPPDYLISQWHTGQCNTVQLTLTKREYPTQHFTRSSSPPKQRPHAPRVPCRNPLRKTQLELTSALLCYSGHGNNLVSIFAAPLSHRDRLATGNKHHSSFWLRGLEFASRINININITNNTTQSQFLRPRTYMHPCIALSPAHLASAALRF